MFKEGDIVKSEYNDGSYILIRVYICHSSVFEGVVIYTSEEGEAKWRNPVNTFSSSWCKDVFKLYIDIEESFNQSLNKLESCLK